MALTIVAGLCVPVTPVNASWINKSIRSQQPKCPPKKEKASAQTFPTKKQNQASK